MESKTTKANTLKKFEVISVALLLVLVCVFFAHHDKKEAQRREVERITMAYNNTVNGFKNVLSGAYGDVTVTNDDWGCHKDYGVGDISGQYLNEVTVSGCSEDEIVMIAYYERTNGSVWYAVAEPGKNVASNGWGVNRNGDEVIFNAREYSSIDGSYNQVAIFKPSQKLLYVPALKL